MSLSSSTIAPDVTVTTIDGPDLSLSHVLGNGQNTLLVFLRHLG